MNNFDNDEFIRKQRQINDEFKRVYTTGGTGRGKTQATQDWLNDNKWSKAGSWTHKRHSSTFKMPDLESEYEKAKAWAANGDPSTPIMVPILNIRGINNPLITLSAPAGWNNYLKTGNFIGCRPIIKPGTRINAGIFEPINFEMV